MPVNNITSISTPITQSLKKGAVEKASAGISETQALPKIKSKNNAALFSMILSDKQDHSLYESLGYDQPLPKQRNAVNEYVKTANQQQRDQIIESMSFHFVV